MFLIAAIALLIALGRGARPDACRAVLLPILKVTVLLRTRLWWAAVEPPVPIRRAPRCQNLLMSTARP